MPKSGHKRGASKKAARAAQRDAYLRKTYGITQEEYLVMAARYSGTCWVCRVPPKPGKNLAVDHDHKLAKTEGVRKSIRGVLCFMCNKKLIGRRRREHAYLFSNAAQYLAESWAQNILGG